jgi:hypothetical protein
MKAAALVAMCIFSSFGNAGVIYTYTGNTFSDANFSFNEDDDTFNVSTNDNVTLILSLASALQQNLVDSDLLGVTGFAIKICAAAICITNDDVDDGRETIKVIVSTDSTANIEFWEINLFAALTNIESVKLITQRKNWNGGDSSQDSSQDSFGATDNYVTAFALAYVYDDSGVWSATPATVSGPSTTLLFALGCLCLISYRLNATFINK